MNGFLLKLLGARVDEAGQISGVNLTFAGGIAPGWVLLLLLVCGALTWWFYRKPDDGISRFRMYLMISLRVVFMLLLLLLLLRPMLTFSVEGNIRRSLVVLCDVSGSMAIKDPRTMDQDLRRAAIARNVADPAAGLQGSWDRSKAKSLEQISRVELMKSALKNERLKLLPRLAKEFDLHPYQMGIAAQEMARAALEPGPAGAPVLDDSWVDMLGTDSPQTAIGDAVRDVLSRKRGQPMAGILLMTDGANNSGISPREAAALSRQEGVPLYIYGVGITSPRDIIVANLFAPEVAFVKDEVVATVRVRSQGMSGQTAKVLLKLGGQTVDEKEITFTRDGETVVPMRFTPPEKGNFELQALVPPRTDETVKDNNSQAQPLRVIDDKIKVLLVEQYPRWEYQYLQAMLLRDRRMETKVLLFEGDQSITKGEKSPYLDRFPEKKEDLFKFDVIVFGDVDPKNLAPNQIENLGEFVTRFGGAFIMVAGKRFAPAAYRKTVIEKMLPVEFDSSPLEGVGETVAEKPVALDLTAAGRASPMFRLADTDAENAARWKGLPPVYWVARVARAKPAAEVFLVDPDPRKENRFGKMPVAALQRYGSGQVLYLGTDNTWRWRRNIGDAYYVAFWGQTIQRLAMQRMLGGSKRTQLSTDRQNVFTGEKVTVYARLFTTAFEPLTEPQVKALYALRNPPDGTTAPETEVLLRSVPEQTGVYRGEFTAPVAGAYKFQVDHDRETQLDFNVAEPRYELGETAMNEALLRDLAAASSGAFFREEDLSSLPEQISQKTMRVKSHKEVDLWSSWFYFLILLTVVTVEWILRKRSYLK
jgi:hypothetical protein